MTVRDAELTALRAHLRRALCLLAITPVACTETPSSSDGQPAKTSTTATPEPVTDTAAPEPVVPEPPKLEPPKPEPVVPEPVELMHMPTCPSHTWCGTVASAEPLRHKQDANPDFEGCAGAIQYTAPADRPVGADLPMLEPGMVVNIDVAATTSERGSQADACCYTWTMSCPGGRPLLDDGEPQLASLREGAGWTAALPSLDRSAIARLSRSARRALAEAWLADARMEHASITSFARARAELAAVGAPAGLLVGCEQAALDERRHARIGFGLVAAYGGPAVEPEPLVVPPIRPGGLIRVALDVFLEGCVGETVAAACVRRAASEAVDPALARLLERIADDEGDHAALAWQTLAWTIERGGAPVQRAIVAFADRLRPTQQARAIGSREDLEPGHGQLDAASQARVRHDAWAAIIDPLIRELTPLAA